MYDYTKQTSLHVEKVDSAFLACESLGFCEILKDKDFASFFKFVGKVINFFC